MFLKPRLIKKWIKALRSGLYPQGRSYLHANNKYCCLGVLCDVYYGHDIFIPMREPEFSNINKLNINNNEFISSIPLSLIKHIGLSENNIATLIKMNDEDECSFNQIADYLESCLVKERADNA